MPKRARSWVHEADAPITPVHVGDCTVFPLVQLHYRVDPTAFFRGIDDATGVDDSAWYWRAPYIDDGRIVVDIGGFVVQASSTTILVDAGMGNGKVRPNPHMNDRQDPWFSTLERAGFTPTSIDTVVFTHLHGDHVGFATRHDGKNWVPAFKRARYLVSAADFKYWTGTHARGDLERLGDYVSDSVAPLHDAGVLDLVESELDVSDEIRMVPAPGHTPGNVCVEITSRGQRGVFSGDMIHHAVQLAFPNLNTYYCVDQPVAAKARRELLDDLADSEALLFPAHFPDAVPGRIRSEPSRDGFRYEPVGGGQS